MMKNVLPRMLICSKVKYRHSWERWCFALVTVLKMKLILYHNDIKDEVTLPIRMSFRRAYTFHRVTMGPRSHLSFSDIKTCFNLFHQEWSYVQCLTHLAKLISGWLICKPKCQTAYTVEYLSSHQSYYVQSSPQCPYFLY